VYARILAYIQGRFTVDTYVRRYIRVHVCYTHPYIPTLPGHAKSRLQGDFVVLAYVHSLPQEVWQKQYSRRQAVNRSIKKHGGDCRSQVVRTQRIQNSYVDFADVIAVLLQPDLFRCVRQILQVNEASLLWGI